jgi:hypothetical protein
MIVADSMGIGPRILCVLAGLSIQVLGQQPSMAPTVEAPGVERFHSFERTYQDGLKRIHLPLLSSYLTHLNQLSAASKEPNPALEREISFVQKNIAEGGLIDLTRLGLPEAQTIETSPKTSVADAPPGAVLILKAENSKDGNLSTAGTPSLTLGEASWPIARLAEGSYEILVLYCLPTMTEGASLSISLGQSEFTHELSKDRTTKPDQFRILRLGRLNLDREVVTGTFTIKMVPASASGFQIRQIIIAKPRSQKPPK